MSRPTGLKAPSKIGKPTSLPAPRGTGLPTPSGSRAQSALEKSARAAGLPKTLAEKYATDVLPYLQGPEPQAPPTPPDDFIIGDRVYVGGTKPGKIQFIGETQFAPGDWAGIVLDQTIGKNDGSVAGVRYFQCEPKRGVFARLTKLTRGPVTDPDLLPPPTPTSDGPTKPRPANGTGPAAGVPKTTGKTGIHKSSVSGSTTNLSKSQIASSPSGSTVNLGPASKDHSVKFRVGDHVMVSGTKPGVLRYLGTTDFAKGEWAGVELDDPQGKNDGSVAGKRYFDCKPLYGLFAPIHKVTKVSSGKPRGSISKYSMSTSLNRDRSGSMESVSSVGSNCSSVSRSRVRLGVTSLKDNQAPKTSTPGRSGNLNLSATNAALQKALKEKEEHIEQLLRERDMERSEIARAASQVDEAERQLAALRAEHGRLKLEMDDSTVTMKAHQEKLERERGELLGHLEEEKRKVEDLQFTIEEEAISKDDLASSKTHDSQRVSELEGDIKKHQERIEHLEKEVVTWKGCLQDEKKRSQEAEDSSIAYLDQIEELTHKLTMSESKIKAFEEQKNAEGEKANQTTEELNAKNHRITELEEDVDTRKKDIAELESKLAELQDELKDQEEKRVKQQDAADELMKKLASSDSTSASLTNEIQDFKSQIADLQRQLSASEQRFQQVEEDKGKLEHQISELMKHSGDSSEQLSLMNQQLVEKDRKLSELQTALSDSTQKLAKTNEKIERLQEDSERDTEVLISKHEEDLKSFQERLDEAQSDLEKSTNKLSKAKEKYEQETEELQKKKDGEITELKQQLQSQESTIKDQTSEVTTAKQTIEQLTADSDNLKFEKEKVEKQLKKIETERDTLKEDVAKETAEKEELIKKHEAAMSEKGSTNEHLTKLQAEKDALAKEKQELANAKDNEITEKKKLQEERDQLLREKSESVATKQQAELKLEELTQEVTRVKTELTAQTEALITSKEDALKEVENVSKLQQELEESRRSGAEFEARVKIIETEREALKLQVNSLKAVQEQKTQLESQVTTLRGEVEDLKRSKLNDDFSIEKSSLQNSLKERNQLLEQNEHEIASVKKELKDLREEQTSMQKYKPMVSSLELEKEALEHRVEELEFSLAESQANENNNIDSLEVNQDTAVLKIKAEKEAAEGQVDFLNSVIVDMQRKNDEMKQRLYAMENGINGADEGYSDSERERSHKPAPRLFCDICDVFDVHDTDDCPMQAMSDSPPPSTYHGSRTSERPYCDICEVFDHWTNDCDDEQTF